MIDDRKGDEHVIEIEDAETVEVEADPVVEPESAGVDPEPLQEVAPGAEELMDRLQRLQAEFANFKKRTERERGDTVVWAQSVLVERLLPVLDDLNRAMQTLDGDESPAAQGMTLIRDKFTRTLTEAGLSRVEAEGRPFNPDIHEALMTQPVTEDQANQVLMELEPGYFFKSRLVRPARVQVGVSEES